MNTQIIAERFCAALLPETVCADLCATQQGPGRTGTNLLSIAEARQVLGPIAIGMAEHAFRAGFAAAEEALGAHGSERLLDAVERAWTDFAADQPL